MLANLRDVRGIVTGETLDVGVNSVRYKMGQTLASKLDPTGSSRLRNIVKSLLALGANMSQSREFRDLFEDVLTKVKPAVFGAWDNVTFTAQLAVLLLIVTCIGHCMCLMRGINVCNNRLRSLWRTQACPRRKFSL